MMKHMFSVGKIFVSDKAQILDNRLIKTLVKSHRSGCWGDVSYSQSAKNNTAIVNGYNILSRYELDEATCLVFTINDRSFTTVFIENEYDDNSNAWAN